MSRDSFPPGPDASILRPKIEVLLNQASPEQAIYGLKEIFREYGHEVSVELLVTGSAEHAFLVEFSNPQDAVDVSLELNYLLFGHSTLVIHVQQTRDRP